MFQDHWITFTFCKIFMYGWILRLHILIFVLMLNLFLILLITKLLLFIGKSSHI